MEEDRDTPLILDRSFFSHGKNLDWCAIRKTHFLSARWENHLQCLWSYEVSIWSSLMFPDWHHRQAAGCPKIIRESPQTRASPQREGHISTKMRTSRPWANAGLSNSASLFKRGSKKLRVSLQIWVWATPRLTSNASLSNFASQFQRVPVSFASWLQRSNAAIGKV